MLAVFAASALATCPDITPYRTAAVQNTFNPALLAGFWYEQAYIDIAQSGASCQTLNTTYNDANQVVSTDFSVDYGPVPFTITEEYSPADQRCFFSRDPAACTLAYYNKQADVPGSGLVVLPTVVVDVSLSADGKQYETLTMYSCATPADLVDVHELVFFTREKQPANETLTRMQSIARAAGVPWKDSDLYYVNQTDCSNRYPIGF